MRTIVLIRRGKNIDPDLVLLNGEIAFIKGDRCFYVGDGVHKMSELVPFTGLVAGDDGNIYTVRVDKDGIAHAESVKTFYRGQEFDFKISE